MVITRLRRLSPLLLLACALPLAAQDLLLEAELDIAQTYVQQQAVYRLRFLHAVDVRGVQIVGPSARLANLRAIGDDWVYEAQRGARRYRVHERRYAVFPFASGTLELAGAHVNGKLPAATPSGERAVKLDFPARALQVLPAVPQAPGGSWLPARSLHVSEQWTALDGGAHRRTIRIEASGVEAELLPRLHPEVPGMELLPGSRRTETRFDAERAVAVSEQSFVLVASREGSFRVPPLQLHWWNPANGTPAVAGLPARELAAGKTDMAAAASVATQQPETAAVVHKPGNVHAAAAGIAALLLLLAFRCRTRLYARWRLWRAAATGDAHGVRDGLLAWFASGKDATVAGAPLTLAALAQQMHDPAARRVLCELERQLYGPASVKPPRGELVAMVAAVRRARRREYSREYRGRNRPRSPGGLT